MSFQEGMLSLLPQRCQCTSNECLSARLQWHDAQLPKLLATRRPISWPKANRIHKSPTDETIIYCTFVCCVQAAPMGQEHGVPLRFCSTKRRIFQLVHITTSIRHCVYQKCGRTLSMCICMCIDEVDSMGEQVRRLISKGLPLSHLTFRQRCLPDE